MSRAEDPTSLKTRQHTRRPIALHLVGLLAGMVLGQSSLHATAAAQDADVGIVILGAPTEDLSSVLRQVMPTARRFEAPPDPIPDGVEFLLTLDARVPRIWVWRRRDAVVLEHPAVQVDDAFAFGIMAYELLQVARTAADAEAAGMVVREVPEVPGVPETPEPGDGQAAVGAAEPRADAVATGGGESSGVSPEVDSIGRPADPLNLASQTDQPAGGVSVAVGVGVDAWLSLETEGPFIVQPTLSLDVSGHVSTEMVFGAGLSVSALGGYGVERGGASLSYARHELVGRVFSGAELGPASTRLLAHLRVGASVVVAHAERGELEAERILPSLQLGLGVEVRQPLVEGFEIFIAAQVDLIPEPLRFTALGQPLLQEPHARLGAQLGLGWRLR